MKVLVTGATGYLGAVAATALAAREHEVVGLARSQRSASALRERGIQPVMGDFVEHPAGRTRRGIRRNLTTMVVPQEPQVQELLAIADFCAVAALLALGKPTRRITKLRRKTVGEIAAWERFDGPSFTLDHQSRGNPDGSANP